MSEVITKELLEKSVVEHVDFISMVCRNKYGHDNVRDVLNGVIKYCNITDNDQVALLKSERFIPAGSILSRCNKGEKGSFSNCYFTPIESDSMDGIFDCQKKLANTFKMRGGSGFDITILRPKATKVDNAAITSSGAVSFLPSFSEIGKVVGVNNRRAAMIATIDIRHPDALDFIKCKAWPDQVFQKDIFSSTLPDIASINISLKISDSFMRAVEDDEDFTFCFPDIEFDKEFYNKYWDGDYDKWFSLGGKFKEYSRMSAKAILGLIAEASHKCGDPGILFTDTAQKNTFGTYISDELKPVGMNPCGEQCLGAWNNCLLGAIVMHKYVDKPYTEEANFNFDMFENDVKIATRVMNIFSDINEDEHPLIEQRDADKFGKRIGLEATGIGDTFAMLGLTYGESDSLDLISSITELMLFTEMKESVSLAKKIGPCLALSQRQDRYDFIEKFKESGWIEFDDGLQSDIVEYGMRNTSFNTFGPTGTLSIISDNCTSGIEPAFKFSFKRKNRIDNQEYAFIHYLACKHMLNNIDHFNGMTLDEARKELKYVEADEIAPIDRIFIQSIIQKYTDASISSTINLKNNVNKEDIYNIYINAWRNNLKGITVFRDGCKQGVLSSNETKKIVKVTDEPTESILIEKQLLPIESAERHKVMWKKSPLYINVSLDDYDPIEIFTKLPKSAGYDSNGVFNNITYLERSGNWDAVCRLISMSLRYGVSLEEVIKQLNQASYSMVDAAGILVRVLNNYTKDKEYEEDEEGNIIGDLCLECGAKSVIKEGGCEKCLDCGFSRCS